MKLVFMGMAPKNETRTGQRKEMEGKRKKRGLFDLYLLTFAMFVFQSSFVENHSENKKRLYFEGFMHVKYFDI